MGGQTQAPSRLILTGFMGAGKSTVGAILARDLGWQFLDLDDVIEARSQLTIPQIFRNYGEADFRERERQAIEELSTADRLVLALGGGAIENEPTRTLLLQTPGNCLIYLEAPLPELLARCRVEGKDRPLLAAAEPLQDRLKRRLPHYRTAHITVSTTGLAPQAVADRVRERLADRKESGPDPW